LLGKDRLALYAFIHSLSTNFGTTIFEPVALSLASTLKPSEREKIKLVAKELLNKLKSEFLKIQGLWDKDATKAEMRTFIKNFLYDDRTGLPATEYTVDDVNQKAEMVYTYLYQQYLNEWRNVSTVSALQSIN